MARQYVIIKGVRYNATVTSEVCQAPGEYCTKCAYVEECYNSVGTPNYLLSHPKWIKAKKRVKDS